MGDSNKEATVEEDGVVQMEGTGEKVLEKEDEVEMTNSEPRPPLHISPNPYVPPIPIPKLEKSHQNVNDSLSCPIGPHDCNTVDITLNRGGKSVKFNGNRPKDKQEDVCLVLKAPKSRKKKSHVVDLIQAWEMVTKMEEGNHDCLLEQ